MNVGLVDERGEIAALYKGSPQNDIGIKTDVIDNVSKSLGMLIRSMSPEVIVADEIGNLEDIEAINYAVCSGCKVIFTAHGYDFEDVIYNPVLEKLINKHIFKLLIFLDSKKRGEAKHIYRLDKKSYEKLNLDKDFLLIDKKINVS